MEQQPFKVDNSPSYSGACTITSNQQTINWGNGSGNTYLDVGINANSSNSVYQDSGKVYPLSLALNFIIKT